MKRIFKLSGWLLLLMVLAVGIFMSVYWESDRSVDELKARWAQSPSQFIEISGMQVHLRDEGPSNGFINRQNNGSTPIVLIHGTSASLHTWDGWVTELKGERRVIRFDLPGFGLTGPDPKNDYTIEHYAQVVVEVLDLLDVDQAVLAGNSLGGNVAFTTALLYPNRVEKLVLIDSSGYSFKAQSVPLGFKIASIPVLNKLVEKVLPRGMVESSVKSVYGNPSLVTEALIDRYFDLTLRAGNRQALAMRLSQIHPGQYTARLSEIKQPTLILWGGLDRLILPEFGDRFHQDIVGSQLLRFEKLGHVPHEEDPVTTVNAFKSFLQETTAENNQYKLR